MLWIDAKAHRIKIPHSLSFSLCVYMMWDYWQMVIKMYTFLSPITFSMKTWSFLSTRWNPLNYFLFVFVFSNNVLLCPDVNLDAPNGVFNNNNLKRLCMLDGIKSQQSADWKQQTGLYINAQTNHIIGNHVINQVPYTSTCTKMHCSFHSKNFFLKFSTYSSSFCGSCGFD